MKSKILVVDDDEYILDLIKNIFLELGYNLFATTDAIDALNKLNEYKPDLILMDINMPEISGIEACRRIRENKIFTDVPIILMTGLKDSVLKLEALKSGADEFLNKPLDIAELMTRVENQINLKKEREKSKIALYDLEIINNFSEEILSKLNKISLYCFPYTIDNVIIDLIKKEYQDKITMPEYLFVFYQRRDESTAFCYRFEVEKKEVIEYIKLDIPYLIKYEQKKLLVVKNKEEFNSIEIHPEVREILDNKMDNFLYYSVGDLSILACNFSNFVPDLESYIIKSSTIHLGYYLSIFKSLEKIREMYKYSIYALSRAAEVWDDDTGEHIIRVNEYSYELAKALGMDELFCYRIRLLAQLHDVGKLHVHPDILKKPGKLSHEEWEEMKKHTIYGAKILGDNKDFEMARIIALQHHESWDGTGYPNGLKGEQIDIAARIVKIVDVYDALRSPRVYKPPFSHEHAYEIITKGDNRLKPSSFDPELLNYFKKHHKRFEEIYESIK